MATNNLAITTADDAITFAAPMLGFIPTNSIVIYLLRGDGDTHIAHLIARLDVTTNPSDVAQMLPSILPADLSGAILVGIAEQPLQQRARELLDIVRDALQHNNTRVLRRVITRNVTEHGIWTDLDTGARGITLPHTDSVLAVTHPDVVADRDTLAAEFAPTEPAAPVADPDVTNTPIRDTLADFGAAIEHAHPTPHLAARIGHLITSNVHLRDNLIAAGLIDPPRAARLWARIAGPLRGEARVQALTIAALTHYIAPDGPRAGLALAAARTTIATTGITTPSLTTYVDLILRNGLPPNEVRTTLANVPKRNP